MQVDIQTLVYAVIAALLLGRLWSVLGTRSDDDPVKPPRQNPFAPPPPSQQQQQNDPFALPAPTPSRMPVAALPPASLAGGLAQVKEADNSFDEKVFLQKAKEVFTGIVTAYADGSLTNVAQYLSPALLAHFQQATDARRAEGQTAQTRVIRVKETEAIAARAEGKQVYVTARFVSDQENILRDKSGTVIGGAEGTIEEVTDIWVFTHNGQTPDAPWTVVETRG